VAPSLRPARGKEKEKIRGRGGKGERRSPFIFATKSITSAGHDLDNGECKKATDGPSNCALGDRPEQPGGGKERKKKLRKKKRGGKKKGQATPYVSSPFPHGEGRKKKKLKKKEKSGVCWGFLFLHTCGMGSGGGGRV